MPKMSKRLEKIYKDIEAELSQLFYRWRVFRQLFVSNGDRIKLMNGMGPAFFGEVKDVLVDAIFLQICRVTDAKGKLRKGGVLVEETVVIEQLRAGLVTRQKRLAKRLDARLKDVNKKCEEIRVHRNKRISHSDKLVLLKPSTNVLPSVNLTMVDDALKAIAGFVNEFRLVFDGSPMAFEFVFATDDGDDLIHVLKCAFEFRELARSDWTLNKRLDEGPFGKA